jgi:hypothetical protein
VLNGAESYTDNVRFRHCAGPYRLRAGKLGGMISHLAGILGRDGEEPPPTFLLLVQTRYGMISGESCSAGIALGELIDECHQSDVLYGVEQVRGGIFRTAAAAIDASTMRLVDTRPPRSYFRMRWPCRTITRRRSRPSRLLDDHDDVAKADDFFQRAIKVDPRNKSLLKDYAGLQKGPSW